MKSKRGFASDNNSGIHPRILESIRKVNIGHRIAYGDDPETASAVENFKQHFGKDIDVYFVFTGTAITLLGTPWLDGLGAQTFTGRALA